MANQYSPSFVHPNFVVADYGTEFGAGVNYFPSQLTFNNTPPARVRSFKHRIFNSYYKCEFTWNNVGVTSFGSSPHNIGFYNVRSSYPYSDFIWIQIPIITTSPQQFRVNVMTDQGIYAELVSWTNIVADSLGTVICEVWVGPDKGAGNCDLRWRIRLPSYGLDLNYGPVNYAPLPNYDEWFAEFYGLEADFGQTILSADQLITGHTIVPGAISSVESFGIPTLFEPGQAMTMQGISSLESWGSPSLSIFKTYIVPEGILSQEGFGYPSVSIPAPTSSALPAPTPALEGDIRLVWDVNKQYVDFVVADRDVERDAGLETAIFITLLTDKQAEDGDPLPDDSGYRGGWFGDSIPVVEDYKIGTKLWLLQRAKTVSEIPAIAKEYLLDGFHWMIEDGLVESVEVTVERRRDLKTTLAFTLAFKKPEGTTIFFNFYYNWEAQILRRQ